MSQRDPFNPVLVTPNPLAVTDEQKENIRAILDTACSDSRFAQKAYLAIIITLAGESITPVITEIAPTEGEAGGDPVAITVTGQNFEAASVVLQAGAPILTNFVNDTELSASVQLSGAAVGTLAISVRNSTGLTSNVVNFDVVAPALQNEPPFTPLATPTENTENTDEQNKAVPGRANTTKKEDDSSVKTIPTTTTTNQEEKK